jgi:branched-chain amino acid transport system permease protein
MTLVGGLGTLTGPVVGALVIILLENKLADVGSMLASLTGIEWFNTLGESVTIVTGLIFITCVLAFRRGIVGELLALPRKRTGAKVSPAIAIADT